MANDFFLKERSLLFLVNFEKKKSWIETGELLSKSKLSPHRLCYIHHIERREMIDLFYSG